MRARHSFFALTAALAMTLGACNGSVSSTVKTACASLAPPALLWPPPSSGGNPDGNLDLWIGYAADPAGIFGLPSLTATGQPTVAGTPWTAPSPGPTNPPGLLPLPPTDQYWTSGVPALAKSTTYTVNVTNTICSQTFDLGSFTTQ